MREEEERQRSDAYHEMMKEPAADHLLVEVGHQLLERSVPSLVGFTEFLQDLRDEEMTGSII